MLGTFLTAIFIGCVTANTVQTPFPNQEPRWTQEQIARSGFGVNANLGAQPGGFGFDAGVNTPFAGINADVGLTRGSGLNNNLLMTVVIGLGLLSLINIVATVVTPWFANLGGDDESDAEDVVEKGRRYQRNIDMMADYVLNGIESFGNKNK